MILNNANVSSILKDDRIIRAFNKMVSNKDWAIILRKKFSEEYLNKHFVKYGNITSRNLPKNNDYYRINDIDEAINFIANILEKSNVDVKSNDDVQLRIYNNNAHRFISPRLSPMSRLNDPLEGLWRYKNTSPATMHIFNVMRSENLISACYTTSGELVNERYMISNYSRTRQKYISFSKKEFDKWCESNDVYFGYVNYNAKAVEDFIARLRFVLGVNATYKHIRDFNKLNFIVFIAFETLINLFYKWYKMSDEIEYRVIKIGSNPSNVPISIPVMKHTSSVTLDNPNGFYLLNEEIIDNLY